jgi:hypothetical protein
MYKIIIAMCMIGIFSSDALSVTWGELIEFGTGVSVDSMRRTRNGGLILSVSQHHTVKLNRTGQIVWQKAGLDHAIETADGGFAGIGVNNDTWFLAKFNSSQRMIWQRTYNFTKTGPVVFTHLRAVAGLGYILAGSEFNRTGPRKTLLLRTDSQGNVLWMKRYPGFNLFDMEIVRNESFILVGRPNVTVLRVNASGVLLFKGMFGTGFEDPVSIQPTLDGNFVVASNRRAQPFHNFITKLTITNNTAKILWRQAFTGQPRLFFSSVRSTLQGYLVSGTRRARNEPNQDVFVMQLNNNGIFQWVNYFGGTAPEFGFAIATLDNHFAIAGSTISTRSQNQAGFVMKFPRNKNGGNSCSFFKSYELPITQFLFLPPPVIARSQSIEDATVAVENSSVEILDSNLQFTDLCGS